MTTPLEREVMKAHTLLDEGYELVADRRRAKTSGWRKPGRPVVDPLTAAVAEEVIDALSDTYRVRDAYHRRVLTPAPDEEDGLDWGTAEPQSDDVGADGPDDSPCDPGGTEDRLLSESYWSVRAIMEKAGVTRKPVLDRIYDGTFDARKDRNGDWKVRVTDRVRRFCGLLFEEVARVDQPFYTSGEVCAMTGLAERNLFYQWQRCTLVEDPRDGRKLVALADEAFLELLRKHGVKPLVELEGFPVTEADVAERVAA